MEKNEVKFSPLPPKEADKLIKKIYSRFFDTHKYLKREDMEDGREEA